MSEGDSPYLEVSDLVVSYGDRTVLDGISFTIRRGEIFVILGGSGSGKTTLLRTLVGLIKPDSGRILFKGEDFTAMTEDERIALRKKIGMCFQGAALFNSMTVGENVCLPVREHTDLEESTIEIMSKIKLELVGLGGFEDFMPAELSGGMKKRAGIARAIAMDPEAIFYDEPSAGLDPIVAAGIDELIRNLQRTFDITSVVVTHEMESVKLIADTVCVLHEGRVAGLGSLQELKLSEHPYIQQFFARRPSHEPTDGSDYARSLTGAD
jgi:phospholipid/cholesterol/gamma-HCH transport system ATP-binding protein